MPIASDGWRFIVPLALVAAVLLYIGTPVLWGLGLLAALAAVFCLYFFRDFDRKTPIDDNLIFSPGDGRILDASQTETTADGSWRVIRIFLSVLDGHVQRSPVKGSVSKVDYKKGLFWDARDPRAHVENEQNAVTIVSPQGTIIVKQIAGLIARRIVCWVKPGAKLNQGERYGLIRFGSQVDVFVPTSVEVMVRVGERVVGGETVLAKWK